GRRRWQARYDAARKRDADFTTLSGDPVEPASPSGDHEPTSRSARADSRATARTGGDPLPLPPACPS
ncbi:hypothetical protein ACWC2M_41615, partial [Streptomyces sp. NPDC001761]